MANLEELSRIRSDELEVTDEIAEDGSVVKCIETNSIEALTQALGYLKFTTDGLVLFRGQDKIYTSSLPLPSVYRSITDRKCENNEIELRVKTTAWDIIRKKIEVLTNVYDWDDGSINAPVLDNQVIAKDAGAFNGVPRYALEPTLQHYGIKTRWLDITDSLPYALVFSITNYISNCISTDALKRSYNQLNSSTHASRVFKNVIATRRDSNSYCYLYAIILNTITDSAVDKTDCPGLNQYELGYLIDARIALPSQYLRPHSQHGMLLFPTSLNNMDKKRFVIFKLKTKTVRDWLGEGKLFAPSSIYPSLRKYEFQKKDLNKANPMTSNDKGLHALEKLCIKRITKGDKELEKTALELINYLTVDDLIEDLQLGRRDNGKTKLDWHLI